MNTNPEPHYEITLTELQLGLVVSALHESLLDNERYLASTPKHKTPEPADSCCAAHLARYEAGREQRVALKRIRTPLRAALKTLQQAEATSWQNTVPREIAGVLLDREDDESIAAAAWLAEHENDLEVWEIIGRAIGELTALASEDAPIQPTPIDTEESVRCGHVSEFGVCIRVRNHLTGHDYAIVERRDEPYPYDEEASS